MTRAQIAKHHAGYPGMFDHEVDVAHEHGFHGAEGGLDPLCREVDPGQQAFSHPRHDRLPDRFLGGEMAEQGALGQVHVFRNGGCCDVAGIAGAGKLDHRLDGYRPAFISGKISGRGSHGSPKESN